MNRNLFQYVEFLPSSSTEMKKVMKLTQLFAACGLDPEYYLVLDSSSDLPYDFYRPGEEGERIPIYLLSKNRELKELSRQSDIVDAISGKRRTDHNLYFPADILEDETNHKETKKKIKELLEWD